MLNPKKKIKKLSCIAVLVSFLISQVFSMSITTLAETVLDDSAITTTNISEEVLSKADVVVSLTSDRTSSVCGNEINFTAILADTKATGTLTFKDGNQELRRYIVNGEPITFTIDWLLVGNHTITVEYSGDSNFNPSTSSPVTITVGKGLAKLDFFNSKKLDSNGNELPYRYGDEIELICRVNPTLASGTVSFTEGDKMFATEQLVRGTRYLSASTIIKGLSVGTHYITAVYNGDNNLNSVISETLEITVLEATPSLTLTSDLNTVKYGEYIRYTSQIDNLFITGTMKFMDGDKEFFSTDEVYQVVTVDYDLLSVGEHVITAVYSGDSNCAPCISNPINITVSKNSVEVSLTNSLKFDSTGNQVPFVFGDNIEFRGQFTPTIATGTATFKDGSIILATVPLEKSRRELKALYKTSSLGAGEHHITVEYDGDDNFNVATSEELLITINKADTTTAITSSTNSCFTGDVVTYTANINNTVATGTVTFMVGNKELGKSEITSGVAIYSTDDLQVGDHYITAVYNGDSNFNSSTSTPSLITVTSNVADSTTTLQSSNDTTSYSDSVTFTATVNNTDATGTITFKDGETELISVPIINGFATYTTSSLTVGKHDISASYSGDSKFNSSTSGVLTQRVNKKDTKVTIVSLANPLVYGSEATFKITVNENAATGRVTILDGSSILASGIPVSNINGVPTAIYKTSSLTIGSHYISARYSGDSNYEGSNSTSLTQTITKKPFVITSIKINGPTSIIIPDNDVTNTSYTANVLDQYNNILSNEAVTWSLSQTINGVSISSDGILTVSNVAKQRKIGVIAKSKTDSAVVGYQIVSLTKALISVQAVSLNKSFLNMKEGSNNSLTTMVYPLNAYCKSISWQSSNPTIVTVDANGNLHAVRTGSATITVTVTSNGNPKSAKCIVFVKK